MNALNILELSEQEIIRRNNLQQLRDLGINPYPAAEYPTNAFSTEIKENFVDLPVVGKDEEGNDIRETATPENSRNVCIAGRIMSTPLFTTPSSRNSLTWATSSASRAMCSARRRARLVSMLRS